MKRSDHGSIISCAVVCAVMFSAVLLAFARWWFMLY